MLDKLPLEIVAEIIFYIDAPDIDTLLAIPALDKRFGDKILLIEEFEACDEPEQSDDSVYDYSDMSSSEDGSEDQSINAVEEADDEADLMASDDESLGSCDESVYSEMELETTYSKYGEYFTHITQRYRFDDLNDDLEFLKNFICVVIISQDSTNLETNLRLPEQPVHKKYHYTAVDPCDVELTLESFEYQCAFKYGSRNTFEFDTDDVLFDSFQWNPVVFRFSQLGTLRFSNTIIEPMSIEALPQLSSLVFEDCECSHAPSKWHLPNLNTLEVIGMYKTIEPLIDFETTGIRRLLLENIVDVDSWSNINNSSLLEISASFATERDTTIKLINLNFQSVHTLILEADCILISGLELPKAKAFKLKICPEEYVPSTSLDTLRSIKAPKLKYLSIFGGIFETVEDIDIPIWEAFTEVPHRASSSQRRVGWYNGRRIAGSWGSVPKQPFCW